MLKKGNYNMDIIILPPQQKADPQEISHYIAIVVSLKNVHNISDVHIGYR